MVHHLPRREVWGGKGVRQEPFELDLGKKVGNLDFWDGGVICNVGFGLRKKSWKFEFLGWWGGGVIYNFRFGLRKKVGNLDFFGWWGNLQLRIWT